MTSRSEAILETFSHLDRADMMIARDIALADLGMTLEELQCAAKSRTFPSHKAKRIWHILKALNLTELPHQAKHLPANGIVDSLTWEMRRIQAEMERD